LVVANWMTLSPPSRSAGSSLRLPLPLFAPSLPDIQAKGYFFFFPFSTTSPLLSHSKNLSPFGNPLDHPLYRLSGVISPLTTEMIPCHFPHVPYPIPPDPFTRAKTLITWDFSPCGPPSAFSVFFGSIRVLNSRERVIILCIAPSRFCCLFRIPGHRIFFIFGAYFPYPRSFNLRDKDHLCVGGLLVSPFSPGPFTRLRVFSTLPFPFRFLKTIPKTTRDTSDPPSYPTAY